MFQSARTTWTFHTTHPLLLQRPCTSTSRPPWRSNVCSRSATLSLSHTRGTLTMSTSTPWAVPWSVTLPKVITLYPVNRPTRCQRIANPARKLHLSLSPLTVCRSVADKYATVIQMLQWNYVVIAMLPTQGVYRPDTLRKAPCRPL